MDNISLSTFRHFVPFAELLAAIMGTIYFYKYKHTSLKYFLYLLWYITITEFFNWYIDENHIISLLYVDAKGKDYNYWPINILDTVSFLVYYYIYFKWITIKKFKFWIKNFAILYVLLSILNWRFIQNFFTELQSYLFIVGAIFLIISVLFYFIELLRSEKIVVFHKNLLFWVSIGLLIYYAGNIPFAAEFNGYALISGIHDLFLIVYILAILMYLIFTFGFIWSKKE